jgi:hypothetical protein
MDGEVFFIPANPTVNRTQTHSATIRTVNGPIVIQEPLRTQTRVEAPEQPLLIPKPVLIEHKSTPVQRRRFDQPAPLEIDETFRPVRRS